MLDLGLHYDFMSFVHSVRTLKKPGPTLAQATFWRARQLLNPI